MLEGLKQLFGIGLTEREENVLFESGRKCGYEAGVKDGMA